jgi:hypothetical protein
MREAALADSQLEAVNRMPFAPFLRVLFGARAAAFSAFSESKAGFAPPREIVIACGIWILIDLPSCAGGSGSSPVLDHLELREARQLVDASAHTRGHIPPILSQIWQNRQM